MKAARWVAVGRVVCEEAPLPSAADGEILLRTAYASICGSDLHSVFQETPPQPGVAGYPGHESVGEVVESRCPGFEPGDHVLTVPHFADGRCMAEYQALPGSACIRLPETAPLSHLLMAQQLGTVAFALRRHPLDLIGQDAAVIGQGSAGAFFTFLLKRAGAARVLVSDKSPARLAYSRQLGADIAVDAGPIDAGTVDADAGGFRSAVLEATGGRGRPGRGGGRQPGDVPAEPGAGRGRGDHRLVRPAGGAGAYPFSFHDFFRRRLTAYSTFDAQGEPGLESFRYAVRLIADGAIDVAPLLSHMLPIDQVEEAFRIAHDRTGNALKVSVTF